MKRTAYLGLCAALFVTLFAGTAPARAQGGIIQFDETITGQISREVPVETWTFEGAAGDIVEITLERTSGEWTPGLALLTTREDITAEGVSVNQDTRRILAYLPYDGVHIIQVAQAAPQPRTSAYRLTLAHGQPQPWPATPTGEARTYYDTLDLSTPEAAVQTFVDAFQREDFPTVYLVFAPETQLLFQQMINRLRINYLVRGEAWADLAGEITFVREGLGHGEQSDGEIWFLFDEMMLAAKKHDGLLIDLSGTVTIQSAQESETLLEDYDGLVIDVIAAVDGIEGDVTFRMVQAPSGRWRVYQVLLPNAAGGMYGPWAVPEELITPMTHYERPGD